MNHREHREHRVEAEEDKWLMNIRKEFRGSVLSGDCSLTNLSFVNPCLCVLCGKSAFSYFG